MTQTHEVLPETAHPEVMAMHETLEAITEQIETGSINGIDLIGAHPDDSLYWFLTARYLCRSS